jgi:hypothetical protein
MLPSRAIDQYIIETLLSPQTPSTSTSPWIDMAKFHRASILICFNNSTTVTGSAITLSQATSSAGAGSKALAFNLNWSYTWTSTQIDNFTQNTVSSNTFTTNAVNSTQGLYVIEVLDTDLDLTNNFNWLQVALATGAATTVCAIGLLYPRYGGNYATNPSGLT